MTESGHDHGGAQTGTDDQHLAAADQAVVDGDLRSAAGLYGAALARDPRNARAMYGLAVAHMGLGNLELAEELLARAENTRPDANIAYQRALIAEHEHRPEQAAELYGIALARDSDHHGASSALQRLRRELKPRMPDTVAMATIPGPQREPGPPAPPPSEYLALAALLDNRERPVPDYGLRGELLRRYHRSVRSLASALLPATIVAAVLLALPATSTATVQKDSFADAVSRITDLSTRLHQSWLPLTGLAALVGFCYALARYLTTTYLLFERRLDVREGIMRRREFTLWLYDVHAPPRLTQNPLQQLFDYATVVVESATAPQRPRAARRGRSPSAKLVGIGSHRTSMEVAEDLRMRCLVERRRMVDRFMAR